MVNLSSLREKLSEKYRLSGEMLSESQLNDNLFYLLYVIDNKLTKLVDRKKTAAIASGKGGSGKSKTVSDVADVVSEEKDTIILDGDFGGPNQWRRMEGLVASKDFDPNQLDVLKGNKLKEYFRKNAPLTNNAIETLIEWYDKGLLRRLNLPHYLMHRDTIDSPHYKRKLGIEDLLINAGENLKILFGLLDTYPYPLLGTSDEQIKDTVSSVFSLPASRIIADTAPGINHGSLYIFSEADIRYVIANLEIASTEEPMGWVEGAIAYTLQKNIKELHLLEEKKKKAEEKYDEQLEKYRKNTDKLSKKLKIRSDNATNYVKEKFIDNNARLDDNNFELIKEMVEYGKALYKRDQIPEPVDKNVIGRLQEDAQKLSKFEDLTPIGISLYDFLKEHGKHTFVKKILEDFSNRTYFAINNTAHDLGESAKGILGDIIKYFQDRYNVTLNQVEGAHSIYSLDESVMTQATNLGVPSFHYLSGLKKFDSPITEQYYNQLKKLARPLVD